MMDDQTTPLAAPVPSQGFTPELTPTQAKSKETTVAQAFGKIILGIVIVGACIVALPFVFCLLLMIGAGVLGPIGAVVVIVLAVFLLRKLFKKKE